MSGRPYEAVKVGAGKLGDASLSQEKSSRPFERFITLTYDSSLEVKETDDLEEYKHFI